jgi:REP element-mobilizing transposase RayT
VGFLPKEEVALVLDHIKSGHGKFYRIVAVQVMSNHVHLILRPNDGVVFYRIMKGIKGVSAHSLNLKRGTSGSIWFDESFDRIIRNQKELDEKLKYMFENPLRAGMVEQPEDYFGWFFQE